MPTKMSSEYNEAVIYYIGLYADRMDYDGDTVTYKPFEGITEVTEISDSEVTVDVS